MGMIAFDAQGRVVRFVRESDPEAFRMLPPDAAEVNRVEFDDETNADIVGELGRSIDGCRFRGNRVELNGSPVTIRLPGMHRAARTRAVQIFSSVDDDQAWAALANTQKVEALRHMVRFFARELARRRQLPADFTGS